MFFETPFYEFGKQNLIFIIFNNKIYHTENSIFYNDDCKDYISLCGISFPLKESETIQNMEKRYMKKNCLQFQKFKEDYTSNIKSDKDFLKSLEEKIKQNKILYFFLSEFIPVYIKEKANFDKIDYSKEEYYIFEDLLKGNIAVINKRVYLLKEINFPSIIRISGKNYFLDESKKTVDKIEQEFKYNLEEKLKREILEKIEGLDEIKERLIELDSQIRDLAFKNHISIVGNYFEYGNIGYDSKLQKVYCLLIPHYNKTKNKWYKEGQGAISVSINEKGLCTDPVILFRENRNSDFEVDYSSLCIGISPKGNNPKQIVEYFNRVFIDISKTKRFHE